MDKIKCNKCEAEEGLVEMLNPVYETEELPMGSYLCTQCYSELPNMIYATKRDNGEQFWISFEEYDGNIYEPLKTR